MMPDMKTRAALVALLCVVVVARDTNADEPVRHVVKANESCSSIALRYYGDTRFVELLHGANPEVTKTPPPHILREGMVLVIPPKPSASTGPDAQLTTVRNQVDVLSPETKPGKPNDPLFRGNRVSTQAASAADVTFRDETQVKLGERTLVIILGDARSAATKVNATSETQLVTGNLRAFMAGPRKDVPAPGSPAPSPAPLPASLPAPSPASAAVGTDAARVRIYDGEAQVTADALKTTRLAVYGGSSTIDARGTTREVARGFGSKAELGHTPTPARPLPPPPHWSTPPQLVVVDGGSATIVGEYDVTPKPDQKIGGWHAQIARDGIFRDVAVDARVKSGVHRLDVQPPGPGRYYVRVSAVDDDDFEGPFGPIACTLVVKATETALPTDGGRPARRRIELEPPDAFCVRVGNVALARIDGPLVVGATEPVRLRCAPQGTGPTMLIAFDGPSGRLDQGTGNKP